MKKSSQLLKDCLSEDKEMALKAQREIAEILSEPLRINVRDEGEEAYKEHQSTY